MPSTRKMSRHARTRCQQRAVTELMLQLLREYGETEHVGNGCRKRSLTRQAKKRVRRQLQATLSHYDSLADTYLVESDDGQIVTVGHRY